MVIPVRNEEHNLSVCLKEIRSNLARKVDATDSDSTDSTAEVASRRGTKVINFNCNGHFQKVKIVSA